MRVPIDRLPAQRQVSDVDEDEDGRIGAVRYAPSAHSRQAARSVGCSALILAELKSVTTVFRNANTLNP
jgi:hypothetical protein